MRTQWIGSIAEEIPGNNFDHRIGLIESDAGGLFAVPDPLDLSAKSLPN